MIRQTLTAASVLLALGSHTLAQDNPINLRFGLWVAPVHPMMAGIEEWIASINEASNGSIGITLYPSEQLGKAVDHYDMARDGIADITFVNPGYNAGRFPVISYGELPFIFGNADGGSRALDTFYRPYAIKEMSETRYCMAFIHAPGTIHTTSAVTVPADLAGLSLRPANGTSAQFLTGAGATTIQASAAELRDLLSRGTADGTAASYSSLTTWGAADYATHHLDLPMYVANFTIVVSPLAWARMSEAQQQVMDAHCSSDWAGRIATHWTEEDLETRSQLESDSRHTFHLPDEVQRAEWLASAEAVTERWRQSVSAAGYDAGKIEAAAVAAIEAEDAGL